MGAHLASPHNFKEFNHLREVANKRRSYWLDINDLGKEGEYVSETTGMPSDFLLFQPNEPRNLNDSQHCIRLVDSEMDDEVCSSKFYFICELY
uniref:GK19388 n=2 Tax=Drosophila willistoni TaxID=7260 RepID=B4MQD2_DROWI